MPDKWEHFEAAIEEAKRRILALPDYADLLQDGLTVTSYTDEELVEFAEKDNRDWVGQYVKYSIDSPMGLTVLIAIDKHNTQDDMADTICHEVGHGLWELLDDEGRQAWLLEATDTQWGPEEAFADHFMDLCNGKIAMRHILFEQITALSPEDKR
jgi:hypothetical protein